MVIICLWRRPKQKNIQQKTLTRLMLNSVLQLEDHKNVFHGAANSSCNKLKSVNNHPYSNCFLLQQPLPAGGSATWQEILLTQLCSCEKHCLGTSSFLISDSTSGFCLSYITGMLLLVSTALTLADLAACIYPGPASSLGLVADTSPSVTPVTIPAPHQCPHLDVVDLCCPQWLLPLPSLGCQHLFTFPGRTACPELWHVQKTANMSNSV